MLTTCFCPFGAPPRPGDDERLSVRRYSNDELMNSGPKPPAGKESNWLYTAPGQPWFTYFRFYVPEKAVFGTNRRNFRQAHFLDLIGSDRALIS